MLCVLQTNQYSNSKKDAFLCRQQTALGIKLCSIHFILYRKPKILIIVTKNSSPSQVN